MGWDALGGFIGGWLQGSPGGGMLNAWNQAQAQRHADRGVHTAMEYERMMSDTAHQREVKDLIAAGLNPTLGSGGSGASSGSGQLPETFRMPPVQTPDVFSNFATMQQLNQNQQKIDIDKAVSASAIAKNLTDQQLTKVKTITGQKGIIKAEAEGQAAKVMNNMMNSDFLKDQWKTIKGYWGKKFDDPSGVYDPRSTTQPPNSPSSGGALP